jgi:hypothetical protein
MILRWQYQSFRNTVHALYSSRPLEMWLVSIGALLVVACNVADYYSYLVQSASFVRAQWTRVALVGLAASAVLGATVGYSLGRWASSKTRAVWMAVLPWPDEAKKRSARSAAVTLATAIAAFVAFFGWIVTVAVGQPGSLLCGLLTGSAFLAPAVAAVFAGSRDADQTYAPADRGLAPSRQSRISRLAVSIDRSPPRWAGLWAQSENSLYATAVLIGSLVVLGGAAGAISIAQWQPWPSLGVAVLGGNLAFMLVIDGQPLLSPVLRSTSVGYAAVWMALIRVPALLSLAWFAAAAVPAIVVSPHFGGESAGALPILAFLDVLFCAAVALNPSSRRRAAILYVILLAVIMYQGLQYGIAYGVLAVVAVLGVVALLWFRARKRFRSHG